MERRRGRRGDLHMTASDDLDTFERDKRADVSRMAVDTGLAAEAKQVLVRADRYNWTYQWSWLGLPIIQMPEDIVALQEIIWTTKPTVVIETGVARGGSVIFLASMLRLTGEGRVIGIEIDLRPHNREAIFSHPLARTIEIIDGSSVAEETFHAVRARISPNDRVMVIFLLQSHA